MLSVLLHVTGSSTSEIVMNKNAWSTLIGIIAAGVQWQSPAPYTSSIDKARSSIITSWYLSMHLNRIGRSKKLIANLNGAVGLRAWHWQGAIPVLRWLIVHQLAAQNICSNMLHTTRRMEWSAMLARSTSRLWVYSIDSFKRIDAVVHLSRNYMDTKCLRKQAHLSSGGSLRW